MRKADWKKKIIKSCKSAGTYKPEFLPTISLLADIMEDYDNARNKFIANGKKSTMEEETDRGHTRTKKNPLMAELQEHRRDALQYWRELGLTPAGFKKLQEEKQDEGNTSSLAEALKSLEEE